MATRKNTASWSDIKAKLVDVDNAVHQICRNFGYGVNDDTADLLAGYGADD